MDYLNLLRTLSGRCHSIDKETGGFKEIHYSQVEFILEMQELLNFGKFFNVIR